MATFLRGLFKPGKAKRALTGGPAEIYATTANGDPAVVAVVHGRVIGIMCLEVAPEGLAGFRNQVNPDKLERATRRWTATDHGEPLHGRGRGPRRHRRRHGRTGRRHGVDHRIRRAPPGEGHHAGRHRHGPHRGRRDHALGVPPGRVRRRRRCAGGGPRREPLRMSCASGVPTAWQAADAIAARLTGGKLPTVTPRYFNQCISLGRGQGLIQYVTADDRAVRGALTGRLAAVYKELVCKSAAWGVANPTLGIPTRRRPVAAPAPEPAPTV
ncbi:hypothetical protein STENM327S_06493 [Streptomyces tendae]